jgi:hypothetical protein
MSALVSELQKIIDEGEVACSETAGPVIYQCWKLVAR